MRFQERLAHFSDFVSFQEVARQKKAIEQRRVFISSKTPRQHALHTLFTQFGVVQDAYYIRDLKNSRLLNYGFVLFETALQANKAIQAQRVGSGKDRILIKRFSKGSQKPDSDNTRETKRGQNTSNQSNQIEQDGSSSDIYKSHSNIQKTKHKFEKASKTGDPKGSFQQGRKRTYENFSTNGWEDADFNPQKKQINGERSKLRTHKAMQIATSDERPFSSKYFSIRNSQNQIESNSGKNVCRFQDEIQYYGQIKNEGGSIQGLFRRGYAFRLDADSKNLKFNILKSPFY